MEIIRSNKLPVKHPGEIFNSRILKRHDISITEAANKKGLEQFSLNNFVSGNISVTPPLTVKLENITGISAGFWLNLQQSNTRYIKNS